jgi:hypothetical protein
MLEATVRKNGVIIPSETTTQGRMIYTKFCEEVQFTRNDRMTIDFDDDGSGPPSTEGDKVQV